MKSLEARDKKDKELRRSMSRSSKKRYGHEVNYEQYKPSSKLLIFSAVLTILIIPLELFLEKIIRNLEL